MSDYTSHIDTEATELDLMERYLEGSLTEDEQREMESTLAEDPILADALEGLALIEDKEEMKLALGRIQEGSRRQINKYVKKRDQLSKRRSRVGHSDFKRTNYYVAAAAAVAVLICTVWVIDMSSHEKAANAPMAQATEAEEKQSIPKLEQNDIVLAPSILDTTEDKKAKQMTFEFDATDKLVAANDNIEDRRNTVTVIKGDNEISDDDSLEFSSSLSSPGLVSSELLTDSKEVVTFDAQNTKSQPAPTSQLATGTVREDAADKLIVEKPPVSPARDQAENIPSGQAPLASSLRPESKDTSVELLTKEELDRIPLENEGADDDLYADADRSKKSKRAEARETRKRYKYFDKKPIDLPVQSEEDRAYGKIAKGQHMADLMVEAVALYEAGSNDESLVLLKEVLQTSPENPAANFYAGSIYQRYSQMKTATTYLKEATKYPQSPLIEDARWELAKVYLARNKNGLAKKLLLKIAKEGNKFADQARDELKKLE